VQISPPEINGPEPEAAEESNEASSMLEVWLHLPWLD
jgi:hypothetical protein